MTTLTLSQKQWDSIQDKKARYNIWVGAVRSGKSFSSLICFEDFCKNGPQGDFVVIGKSRDAIKRNVISPLQAMLGDMIQVSWGRSEAKIHGRTIHLIGANDERAEHKIRGPTFAGAYVDEITIIPESVFEMLKSRLSITGAKLFGTTNPDSPFHWFKKKFLDRSKELDLMVWDFRIEDNPSLDPLFISNIKREYVGLWHDRFILGKWVLAEGTVYDFFDANKHVIDFPPAAADHFVVGIDYGITNPTAFTLVGTNEHTYPRRWLEKEFYWDSKVKMRQLTDTDICDHLRKFVEGYNVQAIYIDPSALSLKVEMIRQGFKRVFDAENEVLDGIRYVAMVLNNGTFKICSNCKKTVEEMQTYRWDPRAAARGEDKPIKDNDHILDSLRYALTSEWFQKDGKRWKPEDVDRLREEVQGGGQNFGKFFDDKAW